MTTLEPRTNLRPTRLFVPPPDKATETSTDSLTRAVQMCVRRVDEDSLRRVASVNAGLAFQPKTLLALLTYCYARGIYGSADVEDTMRRDKNFRTLCQNEFPGARLLRSFRRENRETLRECLAHVLLGRAEPQMAEASAMTGQAQCAAEASRRIATAMFMDQMELEDV